MCTTGVARLPAHLFHQPDQVAIGITQETDPQRVVGHLCGECGGAFRGRTAGHARLERGDDVAHAEVQHRVAPGFARALRRAQHHADAGGVEKCESGPGTEQERQTEHVPIEAERGIDVGHGHSDLAQRDRRRAVHYMRAVDAETGAKRSTSTPSTSTVSTNIA